jgi:hypothetical protein
MRKAILVGSVTLIVAALLFAGGDPWKSKPYQQWDDKDVQRILQDSPWAKVVQVDVNWKPGQDDSIDASSGLGAAPSGSSTTPPPSGKMGGYQAPASNGLPPVISGGGGAQASFLLRWVSSRTVQRAAARKVELAGQLKSEEAEKQLAQPFDDYEIAVAGPDMKPFQSADDDALKKSATLVEKKNKQKISPIKVQVTRAADGKKVQAVVFIFPRKSENGEPTIADDEKGVDFDCSVNGAKIRASFDISKMQDTQGRDL